MKTIDDALELRARIFGAFEMAELEQDPEAQRAWLTFAVIGAGPTGVEMAGQIAELSRRSLKQNFRRIDPASARVLLLDGGEEPLATFGEQAVARSPRKELERTGVELRMRSRVTDVRPEAIVVQGPDGEERDRAATRRSGRPASRPRRSPGCSRRRPAPEPIARGTSKCCPTARCPAIRRCSSSAT